MNEDLDLGRFGRIVYARRMELGLTQEGVAERGGPTDTTIGKIENAEWKPGNRKITLRKLDIGLSWEPGSAARALSGGDPVPADHFGDGSHKVFYTESQSESLKAQMATGLAASTFDPAKFVPRGREGSAEPDYLDALRELTRAAIAATLAVPQKDPRARDILDQLNQIRSIVDSLTIEEMDRQANILRARTRDPRFAPQDDGGHGIGEAPDPEGPEGGA